jgi:hypothetical protein
MTIGLEYCGERTIDKPHTGDSHLLPNVQEYSDVFPLQAMRKHMNQILPPEPSADM